MPNARLYRWPSHESLLRRSPGRRPSCPHAAAFAPLAIDRWTYFRIPDETKAYYPGLGFDFGARHGPHIWMLPVPATYVIDCDGTVLFASANEDYTERCEPEDLLPITRGLRAS